MADKLIFKIFLTVLLFLISYKSFSLSVGYKEEKCDCYSICNKNFTMNTVQDVQKVSACQRGCRFFSLVLHTSHGPDQSHDLKRAKEDCLLSCTRAYITSADISSCKFGCAAVEMSGILCNAVEIQMPQITYSFVNEESDILIHPGEPEPDDALMDPGLRKQIQKSLAALLDATPKIPEIRFTNLPVKTNKTVDSPHAVLKCPKLYWLSLRFEFRNGNIINDDLCLCVCIFVFFVACYLITYYFKTHKLKKHQQKMKMENKNKPTKMESLIQVDIEKNAFICRDIVPPKPEVFQPGNNPPDAKIESIILVFHDEEPVTTRVKKEEEQYGCTVKI